MKKIFFFGDSNTYGYDPRGFLGGRYPKSSRWTCLLQERLQDIWKIEADGMNGRTLPYTDSQISEMLHMIDRSQPLDVFALFLGTNDLWNMARPKASVPVSRLAKILPIIKNLESVQHFKTSIMIVTPPQMLMTDAGMADRNAYMTASRMMAGDFATAARKDGDLLADAYSWDLDLAYDGVHLSEKGHRQFADKMAELLDSL